MRLQYVSHMGDDLFWLMLHEFPSATNLRSLPLETKKQTGSDEGLIEYLINTIIGRRLGTLK